MNQSLYLYLYFILFLLSIYLIVYFNNKVRAKFPNAYNLQHKNELKYYPINYNSKILVDNENKYISSIQSELMLYYLVIEHFFTPIIKIIYYPKKILLKYINDRQIF